ncbi:superoxide dismutase [Micromonospora sp. NPDC049559]|uniref:SMP-30/gluconolactonase/LRE family protein n=1 Tax=Micromonospora sp. NPDC049559 TaxID=3155923 RepID=UPI003415C246
MPHRRIPAVPSTVTLAVAAGLLTVPADAAAASAATPPAPAYALVAAGSAKHGTAPLPWTFALPDGFQPEGIAIGSAPYAYFGSRATGAIYRANLVTGAGTVINSGPGTPSLGLKIDQRGRLFVAGGAGGDGRVLDARTGATLASYPFATGPSFVNDVVLTPDSAWFTDSTNPVLYRLPLGRRGALPAPDGVVRLPLTGDIVYGTGINANGIARTPDGRALLIVQSGTGLLFRVDPATGVTRTVDLGGELLTNGDGLLLDGHTLYVVQNRLNTVAVVRLDRSGSSGRLVERLTSAGFDVPTTVAAYGKRLYLPNARFTTTPTPTTPYTVTAVRRP